MAQKQICFSFVSVICAYPLLTLLSSNAHYAASTQTNFCIYLHYNFRNQNLATPAVLLKNSTQMHYFQQSVLHMSTFASTKTAIL